jgi:spore coat protein CotH
MIMNGFGWDPITRIWFLAGLLWSAGVGVGAGADSKPSSVDPSDAFFQREDVPVVRLEISPAGIETLRAYEFRKGSNPEARTNVAAIIREGERTYTNVAVHLKGSLGSFRDIDDHPALTLTFDKWADGQLFHGLKKISLNNSVQDPSYASEIVSRKLFRSAGLPCPRATHARVELNGRDLGLYVVLEGWNKQFLKRHFSDTRGNLWDSGSAGDITENLDVGSGEQPEDRTLLDRLVAAARETNLVQRLDKMGSVLDVEQFLTVMAMEVMTVHWDGYAMNKNNYRVFHDRTTDRLVFLPQGMDQMFGQYRHSPTSPIAPMMRGLVARSVMQVPDGRSRYLARMEQLLKSVYDVPALTNHVDAITKKVQEALGTDLNARARQMFSAAALKDRIIRRKASVEEQLVEAATPLRFGPSGEIYLTNWSNSRESGSPSFRQRTQPMRTLEIIAQGSRTYASWRTKVYLDAGEYQLLGRLKLEGAEYGPELTNAGATLRVSGDRDARMIREAPDWTPFTCDLTVAGKEDLVLVCEFRASKGTALFDASSLKLVKKSK